VVSLNEHRRHLTLVQRAFVAEKLATMKSGGTGANQHLKRAGHSAECAAPSDTQSLREASAKIGVSYGSAARAREIRNNGTDEDVKEVLSGKTTLNAKALAVRAFVDQWIPGSTENFRDQNSLEFVVAMNERRRHMSTAQRAFVAEKLATFKRGGDRRSINGSRDPLKTSETRIRSNLSWR
jgi:hypothetical protein